MKEKNDIFEIEPDYNLDEEALEKAKQRQVKMDIHEMIAFLESDVEVAEYPRNIRNN